jgi:hypothetical protein
MPTYSHSGRITDAKTGSKISEELNQKTLRHDVRKLMRGGNMKYPNLSQGHLLTYEVEVDLNVLHALMVDRVCCHIDSAHIVIIGDHG